MKLRPQQVESFLQKPSASVLVVHGGDGGRAREIASAFLRQYCVRSFDAHDATPERLAEALGGDDLFGGAGAVRIRDDGSNFAPNLRKALDHGISSGRRMVVECGILTAKSTIRKFCEARDDVAVVACNPPTPKALARLVRSEFKAWGFYIDGDNVDHILECLPTDTLAARNEIAKLLDYIGEKGELKHSDIDEALSGGEAPEIDAVLFDVAEGNVTAAQLGLAKLFDSGTESIRIVRAAKGHFRRIARMASAHALGYSLHSEMNASGPPLYGDKRERVLKQARNWPANLANRAIEHLDEVEIDAKNGGAADVVTFHALWLISERGRRLMEKP